MVLHTIQKIMAKREREKMVDGYEEFFFWQFKYQEYFDTWSSNTK